MQTRPTAAIPALPPIPLKKLFITSPICGIAITAYAHGYTVYKLRRDTISGDVKAIIAPSKRVGREFGRIVVEGQRPA